jgi:hypothetical protein
MPSRQLTLDDGDRADRERLEAAHLAEFVLAAMTIAGEGR